MPNPSSQSTRLAAGWITCAALFLAACSGGGGGGGGGAAPAAATASAATSSVTLAWSDANGPVAGYSVYVQRDEGAFKHELDVPRATVTLTGEPGSTARVIVVAFAATREYGPGSPSSPLFTFPALDGSSDATDDSAGTEDVASTGGSSGQDPDSEPASEPEAPAEQEPDTDLAGTFVWQAGDALRLTDAALETTRLFARPADAQLAAVADFDADGQGDLLWVGPSAQLSYASGDALRGSDPISLVDLGALDADEQVIGAGDFDGDGDGDVLVEHAEAIRARLTAPGTPAIVELGTSAQAQLVGIADFDGNASDDVAWRATTGALVVWLMEGGSAGASVQVALPTDFQMIGAGDFDGSGAAELALRGPSGSVYLLHALATSPAFEATDLANALAWRTAGAVDLDRDGSEELVLVGTDAIRIAGLPGEELLALDPASPWQLVALLP